MADTVEDQNANTQYRLARSSTQAFIYKDAEGNIEYSCVQCMERFKEKQKMEAHLFEHNHEYRYLCSMCGAGLKRKEHLDRHILGHKEVRPHVCKCGKAFKRKEHLAIHQTIHSGKKDQVCELCNKSFYRKDHLQKHMQTHTGIIVENFNTIEALYVQEFPMDIKQEMEDNNEYEQYDESYPESQDSTEMDRIENASETTPSTETNSMIKPFQCSMCRKRFRRKHNRMVHEKTHYKNKAVCSICQEEFPREEELVQHMTVHLKEFNSLNTFEADCSLNSSQNSTECAEAMAQFNVDPSNLLMPRSSAFADEIRNFECEICHKRFKRKYHLKVHANVHLKEKKKHPTVWCSLCNEGFLTDQDFDTHECIPMSQENNPDIILADNQDEPSTSDDSDVRKENCYPLIQMPLEITMDTSPPHPSEQHNISDDEKCLPVPQRVFVCKYCQKPFKRKDHYKIHLFVHTGVKTIFCPRCNKGFYRKDHLQKHMTVHNKPKQLPALLPLSSVIPVRIPTQISETIKSEQPSPTENIKPEITIHAPSNAKLRVPLQIKVPYQMVMELDNGQQRTVTVNPGRAGSQRFS